MTPGAILKVVLIEDSPVLRDLLASMLVDIPGLELIGEADGEAAALQMLEACQPNLAIIDLELNEGNGLNVLRQLFAQPQRFGGLHAIVFSNHAHASVRERCRMLGAEAFFDKTLQMDEMLDYLQATVRNASLSVPPGHH